MVFQLKRYQQRCLDKLAEYLRRVVELDPVTPLAAKVAFEEVSENGGTYRKIEALPGLPYVCLRVPTGGGKTVMASYAVGIAANNLLQADTIRPFLAL